MDEAVLRIRVEEASQPAPAGQPPTPSAPYAGVGMAGAGQPAPPAAVTPPGGQAVPPPSPRRRGALTAYTEDQPDAADMGPFLPTGGPTYAGPYNVPQPAANATGPFLPQTMGPFPPRGPTGRGGYNTPQPPAGAMGPFLPPLAERVSPLESALSKLRDTAVGASNALAVLTVGAPAVARGLADVARMFTSANTSPASFVGALSGTIRTTADALGEFNPVLGKATAAVAFFTETLASVMRNLDDMVKRFAMFSPALAQAEARADVVQTFNDMRRAQEVTPALISYLQARTQLQQSVEDAKARFINQVTPLIVRGMEVIEFFLPLLERMANQGVDTVKILEAITVGPLESIVRLLKGEPKAFQGIEDPWEVVKKTALGQAGGFEIPRPVGGVP